MGELGKYKYPDLDFEKAITVISKIQGDYDGQVTASQLAGIFGIGSRGQGFQNRVEDLKLYGLIEGSGVYKLSELGKRIVENPNDAEAKAEAFLKAPLFKAMHDHFKGKIPEDMSVFVSRLGTASKESDEKKVSIRAARLRNHYNEALPYLMPEVGGWPLNKTSPTIGGVPISQPPPSNMFSPAIDSDFVVIDKRQKVYIAIDNIENLQLAMSHLENAKKRFQDRKGTDKKSTVEDHSG